MAPRVRGIKERKDGDGRGTRQIGKFIEVSPEGSRYVVRPLASKPVVCARGTEHPANCLQNMRPTRSLERTFVF
jgi:hypothetical protein